ncbi:type II toxin-antitoxin system VapC family toxin [Mucilaginibacter sp. UR6-1]|uniref:type II toxin-antitoxin system VapC family toxin n=1 Tax=Mucilaginibacter sp. UR6-1 TaxID=1435643 RepID=UPI001E58AE26|nr:type II toxin-antitoxin system VapC family toxin [Mucilaginibacter sp. UR6-1]MCC8408942.1 type II toxin-antitoxin system VapC family toxin [Mucilaginibacter sp. UR6-1]
MGKVKLAQPKIYLVDSNVLIDYIGGLLPKESENFITDILENGFNISIITKIEVLGHPSSTDTLNSFIDQSNIWGLTEKVTAQTIYLRKRYKIKLPDAIIASTAIVNDAILVTRNIKDFEIIKEVLTVDPYNI